MQTVCRALYYLPYGLIPIIKMAKPSLSKEKLLKLLLWEQFNSSFIFCAFFLVYFLFILFSQYYNGDGIKKFNNAENTSLLKFDFRFVLEYRFHRNMSTNKRPLNLACEIKPLDPHQPECVKKGY